MTCPLPVSDIEADRIQVVVAGPEVLVASGIECFVAAWSEFELVETASSEAACEKLLDTVDLDVLCVYSSKHRFGSDFIRRLSRADSIVVIVEPEDYTVARACLRASADSCVATSSPPKTFLRAIRSAHERDGFIAPEVGARLASDRVYHLTRRERQVLRGIAESKTSVQIATELGVAYKTVDSHRQNISRKLSARGVADLVKHAIRSGLVDL